jgi:hypothetical protein
LHGFRVEIKRRDFGNALFSGSGILSDALIEILSSVGPTETEDRLKAVLGSHWAQWYPKYGQELLTKLNSITIAPMKPKPKKPSKKRALEVDDELEGIGDGGGEGERGVRRSKRPRVSQNPTASINTPAADAAVNQPHGIDAPIHSMAERTQTPARRPPPAAPVLATPLQNNPYIGWAQLSAQSATPQTSYGGSIQPNHGYAVPLMQPMYAPVHGPMTGVQSYYSPQVQHYYSQHPPSPYPWPPGPSSHSQSRR